MRPRVLLIDNYDSFTYNLVHSLWRAGAEVDVRLHDAVDVEGVCTSPPDGLVLSPGPGTPEQAGQTLEVIQRLHQSVPTLGVCLGHQALACAFGATLVRAKQLLHGKVSSIHFDPQSTLFDGVPPGSEMARYNSLLVEPTSLGPELHAIAHTDSGELMAIQHRHYPLWGVQFHPESALSTHGQRLLDNWVRSLQRC